MKNILYLTLLLFANFMFSQSFEGTVTYKTTMGNPNPEFMTDSVFKEKILKPVFGEQGFMLQKYYFKDNKFMSEISTGLENGFEVYTPEKEKIYAWQANSTEAVVKSTNTHPKMDAFLEFVETQETDTILGVLCKKVLLKSKMGTGEFWYNSDYLKVNSKDYADYKLNHRNLIYETYGCLPFRTRMGTITTEVVNYKSIDVSDDKFIIPEFETEIKQ